MATASETNMLCVHSLNQSIVTNDNFRCEWSILPPASLKGSAQVLDRVRAHTEIKPRVLIVCVVCRTVRWTCVVQRQRCGPSYLVVSSKDKWTFWGNFTPEAPGANLLRATKVYRTNVCDPEVSSSGTLFGRDLESGVLWAQLCNFVSTSFSVRSVRSGRHWRDSRNNQKLTLWELHCNFWENFVV